MAILVLSAAALLTNTNAMGLIIQADDGEGNGINPMTFIPGGTVSTNYFADWKDKNKQYPYQDKAEIIIQQDNPLSEVRFDIQSVSNQETWAVSEGTTIDEALIIAFADVVEWLNPAEPVA